MSLECVPNEMILIGAGSKIDPTVSIGERPTRPITDLNLRVGERCVIRSGSVIYAGSMIGKNLSIGHNVVIREENHIGDHVSIWNNSTIDYGCSIGSNVKIHTSVYVAQFTVIEDDVFIAPGVVIANDPHPNCPRSRECMRGPTIRRGAQIGVNVTIVPFISIGEYALIGAGSVVTRDVPARALAYGNPARVVGWIDELKCTVDPPLIDRPYHR